MCAMIGRTLTRSQDLLQCLFSKCASTSLVRGNRWWGKSFSADRLPRSPAPTIAPLFMGGPRCLGLDIWTATLRHSLRCWKTSQSRPPAASEHEASRVLRKALPIIPLCREELAPSCRGWCRLQRDHWERGRERKQERGNSKCGGEMTEVFMSAGLREYS